MIRASDNRRPRRDALFEDLPCGVAVLDRDMHIVDHNRVFGEVFGVGQGRQCFDLCKSMSVTCPDCPAVKTLNDGRQRIHEETGRDAAGQAIHHLVQYTPLRDETGAITHVAAILTDLTATKRLRQEYQTLFEKVPCFVAVLNRDRRVVMANELFRRTFGEPRGEHCHTLFKQRATVCDDCPAEQTFLDGQSHTACHIGTARDGSPTTYLVSTAPLLRGDGEVGNPQARDRIAACPYPAGSSGGKQS